MLTGRHPDASGVDRLRQLFVVNDRRRQCSDGGHVGRENPRETCAGVQLHSQPSRSSAVYFPQLHHVSGSSMDRLV